MVDKIANVFLRKSTANQESQSGTILLISLFILSGILMTSTIIANIIIREIRLGRDFRNALSSLYTAETLIEEALYGLRIEQKSVADLVGGGVTENGMNWSRDAYDTSTTFQYDVLEANDRQVINIYNKTLPNEAAGAESLRVEWRTGAFLEMSILEWDGVALTQITGEPLQFPCSATPCVAAVTSLLSANKAYQVILQARTNDATDLRVTTYSTDSAISGNELRISSPITVVATAEYADARQAIQVNIAQRLPWE